MFKAFLDRLLSPGFAFEVRMAFYQHERNRVQSMVFPAASCRARVDLTLRS